MHSHSQRAVVFIRLHRIRHRAERDSTIQYSTAQHSTV